MKNWDNLEGGEKLNFKKDMTLTTLFLTPYQLHWLKVLVGEKLYPNRAEAIRHAINDLIEYHQSHKCTVSLSQG